MPRRDGILHQASEPAADHAWGPYKIKMQGHLDDGWVDWFEGRTLRCIPDKQTGLAVMELCDVLADQPALHGVLVKIPDLNVTILYMDGG